jgi:salicylate hydroxylase
MPYTQAPQIGADASSTKEFHCRPLRIAIIGGGLAGAAAAGALSRLPDVEIKVYERSDAIREVGALIAIMVSAVRTLSRMLSPSGFKELQRILYRGENTEGIHHRHWRTGEIMASAISPHTPRHLQEGRTGRIPLHKMLMGEVPDGVFEYGRQVVHVERLPRASGDDDQEMRLRFADGSTTITDLVVVADGLYSKIRKQYIPDSHIQYKGQVAYRHNFPVELIEHIPNLPNDTSVWKRNDEAVFLSRLEPGTYSFVAFLRESEEHANSLRWAKAVGQAGIDRLREELQDWDPLIDEVLKILPGIDAYPLQSASWMKSLIRDDAVAFVGDAAHPTAGAYGTGSSFAFSDVWALYRSLWRAHTAKLPTDASLPATTSYSRSSSVPSASSSSTSLSSTTSSRVDLIKLSIPYNIPYALHLYNETRAGFLQRVERQLAYDRMDLSYVKAAEDDEQEYIRRYRERFTINWWLLEHDVDAKWQEVEAQERHMWNEKREMERRKGLKI